MANQKVGAPLFEQVVEKAIETITESDLFDDATIGELRKLAEDGKLDDAEAIMRVLQEPEK